MTDVKSLYAELKPVMEIVATPLFDFSKKCISDRGDFLPHAAVLSPDDKVERIPSGPMAFRIAVVHAHTQAMKAAEKRAPYD